MTTYVPKRIGCILICLCMLLALGHSYSVPVVAASEVAPQISVGDGFMVALAADGTAYAWGSNFAGMLGNGTKVDSAIPTKVAMPGGVRFASVSAGWNHVIALSTDGKLYTWGSNAYGQLGSDALESVTAPKEISFPSSQSIVAVAAGNSFSLALTADGSVYAWGVNTFGQLGISCDDLPQGTGTPQRIEALSDVVVTSIYAGNTNGGAIGADGKVWLWGDNQKGQCGSSAGEVVLPTQKTSTSSYFAVDLALGGSHTSFAELNGSVKSFGTNTYGQFGIGQEPSDLTSIKINAAILPEGVIASRLFAGAAHEILISTAGDVYSFGDNRKGQLGYVGENTFEISPKKVNIPMGAAKVISADACSNTTAVVDSNGLIWTWGENDRGQLGNGSFSDSATPTGVIKENGDRLSLGNSSFTTVYQSSVTVNATVPPPSYSVEIPSGVSVGELKQTEEKADGSHIVSAEIKVGVSGVNYLFGEKMILVTVTTESGTFELSDGVYRLPYRVYGSLSQDPLSPGDEFAVFTQNQTATGRIAFDQSLITREGSYKGSLIFEVTVEDIISE